MSGREIVFFPKPTALVGTSAGTTYYSDPFDVTAWKSFTVQVGWLASSPTGGLVETRLETGFDLFAWEPLGGDLNPSQGGTISGVRSNPARYLRLAVTVTAAGSECIAVVWAKSIARVS